MKRGLKLNQQKPIDNAQARWNASPDEEGTETKTFRELRGVELWLEREPR